jgi:signal transduction histidine kinase
VEPIATTAAAAVAAYASRQGAGARGEPEPVLRSGTAMRLDSLLGELASRDQETGAAVTLVVADPADPARREVLTSVLAARAEADPVLAEELRDVVHGVEEDEELRVGLERDLQFAAHQRLVALAINLGMAGAELETGPSATGPATDRQAPSAAPLQEAEQWFRRAAGAGFPRAQVNLGVLLAERGEMAEAEQWLRKAAATGDTRVASRATQALDRIRANRHRSPGS